MTDTINQIMFLKNLAITGGFLVLAPRAPAHCRSTRGAALRLRLRPNTHC